MPEQLPPEQRERVAVLTIIHEGEAFSPSKVYRRFEPDPELARLPTLLEGLWAALAPGNREETSGTGASQRGAAAVSSGVAAGDE